MPGRMGRASLLVVSNRVYVKCTDGTFFPGSVHSKQDDDYVVEFGDGASRPVHEENLIWLGFWGLPRSCWPKHPAVQTLDPGDEIFGDQLQFDVGVRAHGSKTDVPASFTLGGNSSGDEQWSTISCFSTRREPWHREQCHRSQKPAQNESSSTNDHALTQPRSTVLRLNRELLHTETSFERRPRAALNEETYSGNAMSCQTSSSVQGVNSNENNLYLRRIYDAREKRTDNRSNIPGCTDRILPEKKLLKTKLLDKRKNSTSWSLTRKEAMNLSSIDAHSEKTESSLSSLSDLSGCSTDWTSPNQYASTSSSVPFTELQYETFSGEAQVGSSLSENTEQFFAEVPTKITRKRDEMKKCRKVYGVNNRDSWCTQCKWKKACTRFSLQDPSEH